MISTIEQLNNVPKLLLGNLNREMAIPLSQHLHLCDTWLATIRVQERSICDPDGLWRCRWNLCTGFGVLNAKGASAPYATDISCLLPVDAMFLSIGQLQFLVGGGAVFGIHASTTMERVAIFSYRKAKTGSKFVLQSFLERLLTFPVNFLSGWKLLVSNTNNLLKQQVLVVVEMRVLHGRPEIRIWRSYQQHFRMYYQKHQFYAPV
jgi:hypothetical protein